MSKQAARYAKVQPSRRDMREAINANELHVEGALVRHFIANYGQAELTSEYGTLAYVTHDGEILSWEDA